MSLSILSTLVLHSIRLTVSSVFLVVSTIDLTSVRADLLFRFERAEEMPDSNTPTSQGTGGSSTVITPAAGAPRFQTPSDPGKLATAPVIDSLKSLVEVLAPLVCSGVKVTAPTKITALTAQLSSYFEGLGIACESTLVVMLPDGFKEEKPANALDSCGDAVPD